MAACRALNALTATLDAPVTGLIGPNGAGKTTLLNVLSGFIRPTAGLVKVDGHDLAHLSTWRRSAFGIRRTFQTEQVVLNLSVWDNVAGMLDHVPFAPRGRDETIRSALKYAGLGDRLHLMGGALAAADRRMVEIARCIVGSPKVIMMDEPGAGLSELEIRFPAQGDRRHSRFLRRASAARRSRRRSDLGDLLQDPGSRFRHDDRLWPGRGDLEGPEGARRLSRRSGVTQSIRIERLIVARGGKDVIRGVDLEIPSGRITALLGANGAGKSSLVLAIAGGLPPASGAIFVGERPIAGMRPEAVRRLGVAAVPEGHHVLGDLTVLDNLRVAGHHLPGVRREAGVEAALTTFPELREKLQGARRIAFGRPAADGRARPGDRRPPALSSSPTNCRSASRRSSSPGWSRSSARLAAEGVGVLLIEQFTHIALKIADHVCVMERGHIRFRGGPEELRANPDILHSAYLAG